MLFNLDCSLSGIYLFFLFFQVVIASLIIILWASYLKVAPKIIKTIPYKNIFTTGKWLLGCGEMNFIDFLLNRKLNYCFFISSCTFLLVLGYLNRFYLAMEWFDLVPLSRTIPFTIIFIISCLFFLKTHKKIKDNH